MMCEGFNLRYRREFDMRLEEMKLTRWIGSIIYNALVAKNNRKGNPEDIYPLPKLLGDENETENKKLIIPTKEEMAEMAAWRFPRKLDDKSIMDFIKLK